MGEGEIGEEGFGVIEQLIESRMCLNSDDAERLVD